MTTHLIIALYHAFMAMVIFVCAIVLLRPDDCMGDRWMREL